MEFWKEAAAIFASVSLGALCVYGIVILRDIRRSMKTVTKALSGFEDELLEMRGKARTMMRNFEEASGSIALITKKLQEQINADDGILQEIAALTHQLRQLREYIQHGILQPLAHLAITISALSKGASAFMDTLKKKN